MPPRIDLRRMLTAGTLAVVFGGNLCAGTASAATAFAQGCTGSVVGNVGDQVAVPGRGVAGLVRAGAKKQEILLHVNGVDPDQLADAIAARAAIVVGSVPNASNGAITGDNVAAAVTDVLRGAEGLGATAEQRQKTLNSINDEVAADCGMIAYAANYSALPNRSAGLLPPPAALPTTSPDAAGAPPRDYGNVPAALPGVAPGTSYPTSAPIAGLPTPEVVGGNAAGQTGVRNTGDTDAIAAPSTGENAPLPVLLAVVALAAASAALVRSWVLRKLS